MDYIVVQAGGKGTRLKYLTENKPKALVPVDNLPMLFHLFRKYPDKRFVIIADYKKEVMRNYLEAFATVKYQIVEAAGTGTCAGVKQAVDLIPENQSFMLVWSDLILPDKFELPKEYKDNTKQPVNDYVGISQTFPCRWSFQDGKFEEERSEEHGVAGFFLFTDKAKLDQIPESGELVRWMQQKQMCYKEIGLAGTREFGLIEEYEKLEQSKCRPFNKITVTGNCLTKEPVDQQGEKLAVRESAWYEKARKLNIEILPEIYSTQPLKMEYIKGKNIYEDSEISTSLKINILEKLVNSLKKFHQAESMPADTFSLKEAYFNKTFDRLSQIQDVVPFARDREISVNGKICKNVYFYKRELEKEVRTTAQ